MKKSSLFSFTNNEGISSRSVLNNYVHQRDLLYNSLFNYSFSN